MTPDRILFFEDEGWRRLWPLTATRPVCDLRYGAWRLFEKALHASRAESWDAWSAPSSGRRGLTGAFLAREREGRGSSAAQAAPASDAARGSVLWWNGAALFPEAGLPGGAARDLRLRDSGGRVVGLLHETRSLALEEASRLLDATADLPGRWRDETLAPRWIDSLWALLADLEAEIQRDLRLAFSAWERARSREGVWILGADARIAPDARLDPACVLDAREGPIVIDRGARVEAFTHLVGPAYVGPGTQLLGGRITHAVLGPECRVGGEVEATIFQGHANKRHQGFLGHAVVGEWVNLGALTANSDLKNNYGTVRVWVEGREVDSGERKVGCFLGDHVKTGIGSLLSTGTVVGPGSNLFGGGRPTPRFLPGWSWWDGEGARPHAWDKFLATARTAMSRRGVELTGPLENALREAHALGPRAE